MVSWIVLTCSRLLGLGGSKRSSVVWRVFWCWYVWRISRQPDGLDRLRVVVPYALAGLADEISPGELPPPSTPTPGTDTV